IYCSGDGSVGVLLGNGDGTFQTAVTYNSGAEEAVAIAVADVNGDGKPDIVVANEYTAMNTCPDPVMGQNTSPGGVGVLLGNGDGTFQKVVTYILGGNGPYSVVVADLNGDGKPDIVVATEHIAVNACQAVNTSPAAVGVLLGNGDGTFQKEV